MLYESDQGSHITHIVSVNFLHSARQSIMWHQTPVWFCVGPCGLCCSIKSNSTAFEMIIWTKDLAEYHIRFVLRIMADEYREMANAMSTENILYYTECIACKEISIKSCDLSNPAWSWSLCAMARIECDIPAGNNGDSNGPHDAWSSSLSRRSWRWY